MARSEGGGKSGWARVGSSPEGTRGWFQVGYVPVEYSRLAAEQAGVARLGKGTNCGTLGYFWRVMKKS